jgi:hypothetical protein
MLVLRALLIFAAVSAVISCKGSGRITEPPPVPPPAPPPAPQPVVLVGAADIATCSSPATAATARVLDTIAGTVFTAGDNLADTTATYSGCFAPYWGRHKDRLYAALGNRDYDRNQANDAFDYFGDRAGPRGLGYYSFDLGKWHVVVLNTSGFVDMSPTSAQLAWLRADLAAPRNGQNNTAQCTLAVFHKRRFYQGTWGKAESIKPIWDALYAAGVEFVVNGQDKFYERYAPQTPDGVKDDATGIRQFIVGTGGRWLDQMIAPSANVEVRNNTTWGVIKFTLNAGNYSWQFVPAAGGTFTDSGTGTCH